MSSWRNLCIALGAIAVASLVPAAFAQQPPAPPQRVTIGYVEVSGDPRYEPITGYGRLVLKSRERPFAGAQVGLDEAQALTRDETRLFVANGFGDDITVIDTKSRKPIVSIPVGRIPWGVIIDD